MHVKVMEDESKLLCTMKISMYGHVLLYRFKEAAAVPKERAERMGGHV